MDRFGIVLAASVAMVAGCASPSADVAVGASEDVTAPAVRPDLARVWRVVVDPNVSPVQTAALKRALGDWQAAIPCDIVFDIEIGATGDFDAHYAPSPETIEFRASATLPQSDAIGFGMWYPNAGGRVAIIPTLVESLLEWVIAHEMGHAFHLEHDDTEPSIMGTKGRWRTIQPADVERFAALWCPAPITSPTSR